LKVPNFPILDKERKKMKTFGIYLVVFGVLLVVVALWLALSGVTRLILSLLPSGFREARNGFVGFFTGFGAKILLVLGGLASLIGIGILVLG
jgi:hypothetical protein